MLRESARLLASLGGEEQGSELSSEVLQRLERSASLLHSAIRSAVDSGNELDPPDREEYVHGPFPACSWIEEGFDGIQGHSRAVTVPELLSFISSSRKSGVLSVHSESENFLVQLEHGAVVYARGDRMPKKELLGQLLLRCGALRPSELEHTLAHRGERGEHLGELLYKLEIISNEELTAALTEQIQLLFHRLCKPGDQRFRFFESLRIETRPRVHLNVTHLLLECARVWDEGELTAKLLAGSEGLETQEPAVPETPYRTIDEHLDRELTSGEMELPLLDNAAADLLVLCWEEEVDSERLKKRILRDQGLCAHLLRIANSVAFAPTVKITSVQLAISRLGLDNIREIALAMTVKQKAFGVPHHTEELRRLWRRAAITSGFAKSLCRVLRLGAVRGGLFGLLQDVGKPVVLQLVNEYQRRFDIELEWAEIEELMDSYHTRVGGRLLDLWQLPEWLQQVVRHHHQCEQAEYYHAETMVAQVADQLACLLDADPALDRETLVLDLLEDPVCEALELSAEKLRLVMADIDRVLQMCEIYG